MTALSPGRQQREGDQPDDQREPAAIGNLGEVRGEIGAVDEDEGQQHRHGEPPAPFEDREQIEGNNNSKKFIYNPHFQMRDMRDLFMFSGLLRFPLYEPAISRYIITQRQLVSELVSLLKLVDHTHWPLLPQKCHELIQLMSSLDYSETILDVLNIEERKKDESKLLANIPEGEFELKPSNLMNQYKAVAIQIKQGMPLLDTIESLIKSALAENTPHNKALKYVDV